MNQTEKLTLDLISNLLSTNIKDENEIRVKATLLRDMISSDDMCDNVLQSNTIDNYKWRN